MRKYLVLEDTCYDFAVAPDPFLISLYMRKIFFLFYQYSYERSATKKFEGSISRTVIQYSTLLEQFCGFAIRGLN